MKPIVGLLVLIPIVMIGCTKKDQPISFTCSTTDYSKTHSLTIDAKGMHITYDGRKLFLRNARIGEGEWNYAFFISSSDELVAFSFNDKKTLYHHYSDAKNEDPNSYDEYGGCERALNYKKQ